MRRWAQVALFLSGVVLLTSLLLTGENPRADDFNPEHFFGGAVRLVGVALAPLNGSLVVVCVASVIAVAMLLSRGAGRSRPALLTFLACLAPWLAGEIIAAIVFAQERTALAESGGVEPGASQFLLWESAELRAVGASVSSSVLLLSALSVTAMVVLQHRARFDRTLATVLLIAAPGLAFREWVTTEGALWRLNVVGVLASVTLTLALVGLHRAASVEAARLLVGTIAFSVISAWMTVSLSEAPEDIAAACHQELSLQGVSTPLLFLSVAVFGLVVARAGRRVGTHALIFRHRSTNRG